MRTSTCILIISVSVVSSAASARGDFVTERWGNAPTCQHRGTVALRGAVLTFDLSDLARDATVYRAVFRPAVERRGYEGTILFCPILEQAGDGSAEPRLGPPLELRGPRYRSFDATDVVRRWVAKPAENLGLYVKSAPGLRADDVVMEISYQGAAAARVPAVTALAARHQAGQTFLTWREIEDPVGADAPAFEDFEQAVLDARAKRTIVYRVYRSDRPITAETLGQAELFREVPEVLSVWNLKAVQNTEHPNQGAPTKRSPLRPGYNNVRAHVMTRYRITDDGEPLPRGTGLAVITAPSPGARYYAVTAAVNGAEAVSALGPGATLQAAVQERVSTFPAIVFQRSVGEVGERSRRVDVYNSWVGPPYHNVPTEVETYICRWEDAPQGGPQNRIPLWVVCGTYGSTATTMQKPGWYGARKHLTGAFTVGLAEGGIWQGFHECIGTLRSYDQGVVHNYPQRRVLAAAAWAMERADLFIDPQRVYFWAQLGSWGLRHGDVFAAVMSNGYGNLAIGRQAQRYASRWGPSDRPLGSMNWLGIPQWEYVNLPKWIRQNPRTELPYWLCWPAYGAFPSHTIGDFGFLPWPEMFHAMASTKRAFAAVWNSNGPGAIGPLRSLAGRIRRDQSLPAFTRCSLDASPGDGDFADAQKTGGINLYQVWEPETIVDEPGRWAITLHLRPDCPEDECTTDLTPRRCQRFKPEPGGTVAWTSSSFASHRGIQSGTARVDRWGLVTVEGLRVFRERTRVTISRR